MANRERAPRRGHTWDPWPCCQAEVDESEWYRGRPKREVVCPDCTELIRLGKDARRRSSDAGEATYRWAERSHDWPSYYGPYHFGTILDAPFGEPRSAGEKLRNRMFELVGALSHPAPGHAWQSRAPFVLACNESANRISPYQATVLVTMDPQVRERLDAFDQAVREALESAYHEGKRRGQSILLNLAGDEMTLTDFNRRTAEGAE